MYSVYTMPETTDEESLKNGHGEDVNTEEEEEEDNEHDINGIGEETNGWCARQGKVDGNRVILVGRIDPMEHVEPVYGTDEDGDEDDDDEDDDDDSRTADRDGCGSDCSHGRSEEIAAESDGSVLDAWAGGGDVAGGAVADGAAPPLLPPPLALALLYPVRPPPPPLLPEEAALLSRQAAALCSGSFLHERLSALIGPETARPPGDARLPAGGPASWGGAAAPFPAGGTPRPRRPRPVPIAPAPTPAPAPDPAPGTFSLENLLRGGAGGGDDRPYSCPACRQRFARYSHYARHLYFAHHNEAKPAHPPGTGIRPKVSLATSDVALPVNSEVPGGPQDGPTSATFVYGDTLIFRGAPPLLPAPSPRVLSPPVAAPIASRSRPSGLGDGGPAAPAAGARSYDCPVCEKKFPDRESRARHAQEHEQFHCGVCGRGFRDEVERDHHTSMYAGKPAHKCEACGKCFHLTHSFARHMRTHTGEQPFACEVCGKRFNDSGNMAKHMRTHTGDLPFPCPQCPRRFSDRANRAKHARTHHGDDRPFPCGECGRTFANGSNLARHLKAAHRPRNQTPTPVPTPLLTPHLLSRPLLLPAPPRIHLLAEGVAVGHSGTGQGGGVVC